VKVESACGSRAKLGEGPAWDAKTSSLLWVDILGNCVHRLDPVTRTDRTVAVGRYPSAAIPTDDDRVLVCRQGEIAVGILAASGLSRLVELEPSIRTNRTNDAKCDPDGRLYVGTMRLDASAPDGTLYRVDWAGPPKPVVSALRCSNGMGWSPDSQFMYLIDSVPGTVDVFDFDRVSGEMRNRRTLITVPAEEGMPDGMCVDTEGGLWVAIWGGSSVRRYSPNGQLDAVIDVPTSRVTSCCFGGAQLDDLYITTAGLDDYDTHSGRLFRASPGIGGLPTVPFATGGAAGSQA
jgi:sugar lactone lactonase YvrE